MKWKDKFKETFTWNITWPDNSEAQTKKGSPDSPTLTSTTYSTNST